MSKQIRNPKSETRYRIAVGLFFCALISPKLVVAQPERAPPQMLADAELTAVTFIDPDRGWAVGDRGAIWHTDDGGRAWKPQHSPVACRLEAVQFLDANSGWIAGGWTQPYTHETHGVVLRTRDGGRTWQQLETPTLPGLKHLRMFDARLGAALGDSSPLYPAGAFRTSDGGRTWSPVPKGQTLGWATGDFIDANSGAVAGVGGELAIVGKTEIRPAQAPAIGLRMPQRMVFSASQDPFLAGTKPGPGELEPTPPTKSPGAGLLPTKGVQGWLVGDGGLVLASGDGGATWNAPAAPLPAGSGQFDFRAVAARGSHVWIAGTPGTAVFHSADGGQSWQQLQTDQTRPIRGLFFLDEYRGWAVGALGTILHTRDGGQTWREQRSGGRRAALLGIFSESSRVPLALVAQQGGSEGFLTAVEILGRPAECDRPAATERLRLHEATTMAGGSYAEMIWQFPLPPQGLNASAEMLLARWNDTLARSASEGSGHPNGFDREVPSLARRTSETHSSAQLALEERLVRCIRQWQPEVIVTEDVSPRGEDPLGHLTNQLVLAAAMKAGDLTAYSDQIALAGLEAWKVKKVVAVVGNGRQGVINLTPAQWMPRLGRSLAEQAALGKSLLARDVEPAPTNIGLAVLIDHLPQESGRRDAMSGIVMTPGSAGRRELASPPPGDLEQLSRLAQKRHNVEQLLARIAGGKGQAMGQMMQVGALIEGMPEQHQGEILWQVGQRLYRAGQGEQAAEALGVLLEKHPQHPLSDAAARWLVAYYASSEVLCRQRKDSKFAVQVAKFTEEQNAAALAGTASGPAPAVATPAAATIAEASAVPPVAAGQRSGRAIALARLIEQTRPALYADPGVRFPLAVAQRHAGQSRAAEQWLDLFARQRNDDWGRSAAAEGWLTRPQAEPPKRLVSVVTALSKPKLDGRLDDPLWQVAKPCSLTSQSLACSDFQASGNVSAGASLPATVVLAFDEEFLYFAASCRKVPGQDYASDNSPRTPDADLAGRDRLTLWLDVDRDYGTGWELTIDHRGWPAESCWGDATWNPEWFIAAAGDENWWTVEAAIPLSELALKKPAVRDVWSVGLTRVIPRHGIQSLAPPATARARPECGGLLTFE